MKIELNCENFIEKLPVICSVKGKTTIGYKISKECLNNNSIMQKIPEKDYYGVYIFIGKNTKNEFIYYIGQSKKLSDRLKNKHGIDNWSDVLFFTSKSNEFDDTDIAYIEKQLIVIAKNLNKDFIKNGNNGTRSNPDAGDVEVLDECIELIKCYAYALGCELFLSKSISSNQNQFICYRRGADARLIVTNDGFKVLKDSRISNIPTGNLKQFYIDNLIKLRNKHKNKISNFVLNADIDFKTLSEATKFVVNTNANGKTEWKDSNGKCLGDIINNININRS